MASGEKSGSKQNASGKSKKNQKQQEHNLGEELGSAASEASETVQGAASDLTQNFRQQITGQITEQQKRAVDALETVALLFQQAGEHARKEEKTTIANYADQAAEQIEKLSQTVGEREVDNLLYETKQLAQKQPAWLVGGALAAGFLGARFLRSSGEEQESQNGQQEQQGSQGSSESSGEGQRETSERSGQGQTGTPGAYGTGLGAPGVPYGETAVDVELEVVTNPGAGSTTGLTDTSALEGTILEEDAAILEELEKEERLRREAEERDGSTTDDSLGTETR